MQKQVKKKNQTGKGSWQWISGRQWAIRHMKTGVEKYTRTEEQERSVIQKPKAGRI